MSTPNELILAEKVDGRRVPKHIKTPELSAKVQALSGFGAQQTKIATFLGMGIDTLRKYYEEELEMGEAQKHIKASQSIFMMAVGDPAQGIPPNLGALCFYAKTQMGWRETAVQQHQMLDKDGKPVNTGPVYTVSQEELRLLNQELEDSI